MYAAQLVEEAIKNNEISWFRLTCRQIMHKNELSLLSVPNV